MGQAQQEEGEGARKEETARTREHGQDVPRRGIHRAYAIPLYITPPNAYSQLGDLVGLKVSHNFDEMEDGEAHILTLKDSRILDNEGRLP